MRRYSILVQIDPEAEDCPWWMNVPALPGCFTQGHTIEQAIERAHEAIELHLEGLVESGEPIPAEPVLPLLHVVGLTDIPAPVGA